MSNVNDAVVTSLLHVLGALILARYLEWNC